MTLDPLARCDLLKDLSDAERRQLDALGENVGFAEGETFVHEGTRASCFYILLSGKVEVTKGDDRVAELHPGALIGEMALFNRDTRTSSVTALSPIQALCLDAPAFSHRVLHHDPLAVRLMERMGRIMVERLQARDSALLKEVQDRGLATELEDFGALKRVLLSEWALKYHAIGRPGKLAITPTKPVGTAADLSVAYSPGVAEPCLAIASDLEKSFDYTTRGHLVGVITNGSAVLGLGNIGPHAAKPVMEGKAVLFKRFGDVDAFDIEVDTPTPEAFIDVVCALAPTFGGINLEDIKAPECFEVEAACKKRLDIPVFHDDQHGTAIIAGAGLLNALEVIGKAIEDVRVVFAGAGAAGFACARYFLQLGVTREHLILSDIRGVVYEGRGDRDYLASLASHTEARTLAEALKGADVFVGVSAGGVLKPEMLMQMARDPIVFALANPNPEIEYGLARRTREDVVMATGRSDYPNQINNVIAFPYIFRGALDVRATVIDEAMKIAATRAIAALAKKPVHPKVLEASPDLSFGRDYLIPKPFDPRLLVEVASAVAEAAIHGGTARRPIDIPTYRRTLAERRRD